MDKTNVLNLLSEILPKEDILIDQHMKNHTSFKIGGPADFIVTPRTSQQVIQLVGMMYKNNIPYHVMGNGSNLIVKEGGIRGVVIKIYDNFNQITIEDQSIWAQAGILLSTLSNKALKSNLKGLEFASGIPGTLGGAVAMNAGAYDGEMKDVVVEALVVDKEGNSFILTNQELNFGYRQSTVQKEGYLVLEAKMKLVKADYQEIKAKMDDFNDRRKTKQPLSLPSAGSTFRRPEGHFAGKLIEDAGLRGYRIGDAQVSELHCGFVVNVGNATADDVINLIKYIQNTVHEKFAVELVPEVKIVGEEK
jgi:UDP-N-acetylmuramate dehydrogenase